MKSEADAVLRVENLHKSFGALDAVRGVSFTVERGGIFGLIGPNGSGKTTTLRCLLSLAVPDQGETWILGEESRKLSTSTRRRIGYVSEKPFPYAHLPVAALLEVIASLHSDWDPTRVEATIQRLQVPLDVSLKTMSLGQRRRAEFALALVTDPDVFILDDPWLGLDAAARQQLLAELLRVTRDEGKTVLFTSHVLTDVERIADRVGILVQGELRALDDLDSLKSRCKRIVVESTQFVPELPGVISRRSAGATLEIVTAAFDADVAALLRDVPDCRIEDLNLESIFIAFAGTAEE